MYRTTAPRRPAGATAVPGTTAYLPPADRATRTRGGCRRPFTTGPCRDALGGTVARRLPGAVGAAEAVGAPAPGGDVPALPEDPPGTITHIATPVPEAITTAAPAAAAHTRPRRPSRRWRRRGGAGASGSLRLCMNPGQRPAPGPALRLPLNSPPMIA
ncbi:hypothetical protein [Actinomadura rudentiformis]|uniref:hypothetical protein n=1 Tax=Actinomadura rudentiformis TaxID=359158 RepID=UPI001CEF6CD0|nr:hypothetical protein [Actinomadura rudentiformis]